MAQANESVFGAIDRMTEAQTRSGHIVLPASIVDRLEENGVNSGELQRIVGAKADICRLVDGNEDLTPDMADRVSRLAHVINIAERVFGKREKAFLWLRAANAQFDGKAPIDLLDRETGARIVEESLMQIEYGIFA